jgi:peptide subunit release factor 1 (eRF1)
MNKELITSALEDQDLTQEQIADVIAELEKIEESGFNPRTEIPPPGTQIAIVENDLRNQLDIETDWRVKARIAARLISMNLD